MEWSEILADPSLHDLPYKIETNSYGQIVMSPASNEHGDIQFAIAKLLEDHLLGGRASIENSIATTKGAKVADVTWRSHNFLQQHAGETPFSEAPDICVEVLSPSNTREEIDEKRDLYFQAGAKEVWVCRQSGAMEFYTAPQAQAVSQSRLAPDFPGEIVL